MKQRKTVRLFIMIIVGIAIYSCYYETENEPPPELTLSEELANNLNGQIILGKKLENPYSVKNIKKAFISLMKKNKTAKKSYTKATFKGETSIEVTDYYVKFWIENDEQKNLLLTDSLNLSIVPLDYEIVQEGDYLVDEKTVIEQAQWLYTSVVVAYQFHTGITYEKIEDLFLIEDSSLEEEAGDEDEDESTTTTVAGKSGISKKFLYDLEDESLKLTGNYTEPETTTKKNGVSAKRSKVIPKGLIQVANTVTGTSDPVVGVKVKTRRWFKWAKGWTNSQGYYKVNRGYRRDVHYTVVFKNTLGFHIWPSTISISSARYRAGKHSKYGHNITFSTTSVGWRWATVNNATVKYLDYCTQFGIGKPHSNLRIVANGKTGGGAAPMLRRTWGWAGFRTNSDLISFFSKTTISVPINALWLVTRFVLPDIIIKANANQGTSSVFSTTFHELAHASHHKKVGSGYWIKYINYIITYGKSSNPYGDGHGKNSGVCGIGEMWGNYLSSVYMDREFPRSYSGHGSHDYLTKNEDWYNPGFMLDVDNISDITTPEIFSCLTSSTDAFSKLISKLKTKTINDDQVDNAFANYTDWP